MARYTHAQVTAFTRALGILHDPLEGESYADRLFRVAGCVVAHDVAGVSMLNRQTQATQSFLSCAAHGALARVLAHADDFYRMPGVADGAYFSTAAPTSYLDFTTADAFRDTAFYQMFFREMDVLHDVCVNYDCAEDRTFCQLNLARRGHRFSREERELLGLLQPHLRQRYRRFVAEQGADCPVLGGGAWLACTDAGRVRAMSPGLRGGLAELGFRVARVLPDSWLPWLRSQLQPCGPRGVLRAMTLRRGERWAEVYCVPGRMSGEHRLVFVFGFRGRTGAQPLSLREAEVARWVALGKTNAEIGVILGISVHTVKRHVERVLDRLGVENRSAVAAALVGTAAF